ncbi:MAG TPA: IPT/TIG domain-containing protein, partial [Puia sp.]|nr:IPT/TIG domain-containing protein [Puia sp.]
MFSLIFNLFRKHHYAYFILLLLFILSGFCGRAQKPSIIGFSPTFGLPGATVTISGINFSSNPKDNVVRFGAVATAVRSATATSLTVSVPAGVTYQPISVTVNG